MSEASIEHCPQCDQPVYACECERMNELPDISNIDLEKSDRERALMIERFGFVPLSVITQLRYGYLSKCMLRFQGERPGTKNSTTEFSKNKVRKLAAAGHKVATIPPAGSNREALSIMPAELVDFFVKFYCERGQVYLDPFMAQGIQMQVAHLRGLDYWGYDISETFVDWCTSIIPRVQAMPRGSGAINIFRGDSRKPDHIPDGIGDFSFHSPPYWDIEFYGDEPEQLGTGKTYHDFLDGMREVAAAWLPKFRPGAWHVVNVGDFTRHGVFYCYHADIARTFQEAGWLLVDMWVIDQLVASSNRIFAVSSCLRKRAPRCHEYALVFQSPP